jgi:hypothetical protein
VPVRLEEYDADDAVSIRHALALIEPARELDAPWHPPTTVRELVRDLRHGWDGEGERHFLGVRAGRVVAECALFAS